MSNLYAMTNGGTIAHRVGENEWYINNGAWGYNILTDDSVVIAGTKPSPTNTIMGSVYVFEADDDTMHNFNPFTDVESLKAKCPQLDWKNLPTFEVVTDEEDDDIRF